MVSAGSPGNRSLTPRRRPSGTEAPASGRLGLGLMALSSSAPPLQAVVRAASNPAGRAKSRAGKAGRGRRPEVAASPQQACARWSSRGSSCRAGGRERSIRPKAGATPAGMWEARNQPHAESGSRRAPPGAAGDGGRRTPAPSMRESSNPPAGRSSRRRDGAGALAVVLRGGCDASSSPRGLPPAADRPLFPFLLYVSDSDSSIPLLYKGGYESPCGVPNPYMVCLMRGTPPHGVSAAAPKSPPNCHRGTG